jgi:hypothetical protein
MVKVLEDLPGAVPGGAGGFRQAGGVAGVADVVQCVGLVERSPMWRYRWRARW